MNTIFVEIFRQFYLDVSFFSRSLHGIQNVTVWQMLRLEAYKLSIVQGVEVLSMQIVVYP
jgi:hypothetical protein